MCGSRVGVWVKRAERQLSPQLCAVVDVIRTSFLTRSKESAQLPHVSLDVTVCPCTRVDGDEYVFGLKLLSFWAAPAADEKLKIILSVDD